jgi:hypothetical protein
LKEAIDSVRRKFPPRRALESVTGRLERKLQWSPGERADPCARRYALPAQNGPHLAQISWNSSSLATVVVSQEVEQHTLDTRMTTNPIAQLTDREVLEATARAVDREQRSTAELIGLLAELDARKLYLEEGYPSLFAYCTHALHLSEPAAYHRITAARAARRFPVLTAQLAEGDITLTTITLLAAHLTDENCDCVLDAARHKSKREIEQLVASLHPQPDIPSSVQRLPEPASADAAPTPSADQAPLPSAPHAASLQTMARRAEATRRTLVAPLAPERYLLRVTISGDAHRQLERARSLLRHSIPDGDPAMIVERALATLVEHLEKKKAALTRRTRQTRPGRTPRSRRIPAAVRRAVWRRDEGRCAFVGSRGRCRETGFLEFHHVRPFAVGGQATVDNLELRCRSHNAHEARAYFEAATPSGRSWNGDG